MCGIAGIIGQGANLNDLEKMLDVQQHRGPDYTGRYSEPEQIVLGHNRLSIIDLTPLANQPMSDPSGRYQIIFNGEIYNYLELKNELNDKYSFRTNSDTEVLLAAYQAWGSSCLNRFIGMFSFAIWDKKEQVLFAARDRFGVKPFYYHFDGTQFSFASEIKGLWAAGVPKIPNESVWASYLAYGTYGLPEETFWKNIQQLPGGHLLTYKNGRLKIKQWYDFQREIEKTDTTQSEPEKKAWYEQILMESVKLRFRADVKVGFNLSGGLDSSTLLAIVDEVAKNTNDIAAYTFTSGHKDYDELPWVEKMIQQTGHPLVENGQKNKSKYKVYFLTIPKTIIVEAFAKPIKKCHKDTKTQK